MNDIRHMMKVYKVFNLIYIDYDKACNVNSEWNHKEDIENRYANLNGYDYELLVSEGYINIDNANIGLYDNENDCRVSVDEWNQ